MTLGSAAWGWALALAVPACAGEADEPPWPTPLEVEVRGVDLRWTFRHPGPDGRLHTPDDRVDDQDLRLPAGVATRLRVTSGDFVYSLRLPSLRQRVMAVPDLWVEMRLDPQPEGTHALLGDQLCGDAHPDLHRRLSFEAPTRYRAHLGTLPEAP